MIKLNKNNCEVIACLIGYPSMAYLYNLYQNKNKK